MSPLMPDDPSGQLYTLAIQLVEVSAKLSNSIHPTTRNAIADFLRPMNSYYSNLIEGHDTHPIDIAKALKENFAVDSKNRSLQLEAKAHIEIHKTICHQVLSQPINPFNSEFLKWIHKEFYKYLPQDFRQAKSLSGELVDVIPGEFRTSEVKVGHHIGPASANLAAFINRFEDHYKPAKQVNKLDRIIAIAASHHRLAWIHPFLDGNGRVIRLFTDAVFVSENLHASGLWSMSRGLARHEKDYKEKLANADRQRWNDYDGRGNLSNKGLVEFCKFFFSIAIDQIQYMIQVLDIDNMLKRIHSFVDLMVSKQIIKTESRYILETVFLKGEISKKEVERVTGKSDKTAKAMAETLLKVGLLVTDKQNRFASYRVAYPIDFSSVLFSGLYPKDKEIDMLLNITAR